MTIEKLSRKNINHCVDLAMQLWPDATEDELLTHYTSLLNNEKGTCFLAPEEQEYIGFVHISLRGDYVEGCTTSPVAYIEGIYVKENQRGKRIATALIKAAEDWGLEKNCKELASDCELNNKLSYNFHTHVGFCEANRIICFVKNL